MHEQTGRGQRGAHREVRDVRAGHRRLRKRLVHHGHRGVLCRVLVGGGEEVVDVQPARHGGLRAEHAQVGGALPHHGLARHRSVRSRHAANHALALRTIGTRAIKSQTRASGAEARRRRGRVRARSPQRDGAGARLHAAVRPADPGGAAQEGGARTICSATRVRSRKPSTRLPRGLPAALSHPSPPTSASIAAPAAMDARGRRRPRASAAQAAPVFPSLADGQQSGLPAILQHGMAFERASDRAKGPELVSLCGAGYRSVYQVTCTGNPR